MIEHLAEIPAWATSGLCFLLGLLLGHWLSIGRDIRKAREDAFGKARAALVETKGPACLSASDTDAVLHLSRHSRRRRLRAAIDRCQKAAKAYYCTRDAWGTELPSKPSATEMHEARAALLEELRRV